MKKRNLPQRHKQSNNGKGGLLNETNKNKKIGAKYLTSIMREYVA